VNAKIRRKLERRKKRILYRLHQARLRNLDKPVFAAANILYDVAGRARGLAHGGIGAFLLLARRLGLVDAIDSRLHLLKIHLPYHESDHVLNLAFNALCEGSRLEHLELRRNDEVYLDALGAARIPDPTTAGDFCRRFAQADIDTLQDIFDDTRIKAWSEQPADFFGRAILDMDGTLVATTGRCKKGMDIGYDGTWGYHPLVISLANTHEVMRIVNRPANRPSHEGCAREVDRSLEVCFRGGFRKALLRGDTDFSQTEHLDRWNADKRVQFLFGYDAKANLDEISEQLPEKAWKRLDRPARAEPATGPRRRPDDVKDQVVRARGFETLRLRSEQVAEFNYRPVACRETYRMIVVRKNISHEKGEERLYDEIRFFYTITNDWTSEPDELVFLANDRCDQENLLAQLKGGCHALSAPVNTLESNGAYMVMTALGWNLKAWFALSLPEAPGRWREKHRAEKKKLLGMEFATFVQALVRLPCQLVRTGRRLVFRLLSWNAHQATLFRVLEALRRPLRC